MFGSCLLFWGKPNFKDLEGCRSRLLWHSSDVYNSLSTKVFSVLLELADDSANSFLILLETLP